MKRTLLIVLALVFTQILHAQWYYTSLMAPTTKVVFVTSTTGFASTGYTIAKTTDGGANWTGVAGASMDSIFLSMSFPSPTVGFAVGMSGNMIKTTDGGTTWNHLTGVTTKNLWSVCFTDVNTGYIGGESNTLFKTTDGGSTWQALVSPTGLVWSMAFTSPTFGILAGNERSIYRTQDGGLNWLQISFPSPNKYISVCFGDEQTAYGCGAQDALTPCMIKSTDGGFKWQMVPVTVGKGLFTVRFLNSDLGYAAGYGGTIMKTTDGGANWGVQQTPDLGTIYDLWFTDANHGFAGGAALLKTENGGGPAGIFENENLLLLSVYPNPATDRITISPEKNRIEGHLTILNTQGKKVLEQKVCDFPMDVMVSHLHPGLYLIRIDGDQTGYAGKFIKE